MRQHGVHQYVPDVPVIEITFVAHRAKQIWLMARIFPRRLPQAGHSSISHRLGSLE
jgi:hypothetical protein